MGVICLSISFLSINTQARVFDFTKENFATYLAGTGQTSVLANGVYDTSSLSGTTFSDTSGMTYAFSGGIGILFGVSNFILRAGVEILRPKKIEGQKGTSAASAALFTLNSDVLAVIPNVGIEYSYHATSTFKAFVGGTIGLATVDFGNTYTMTATEVTNNGGTVSFAEEGTGSAYAGTFSTGMETILSDNVTFLAEVGYRYLRVEDLTHKRSVGTFLGSVTKGDPVVDVDGAKKVFDLSGPFGGLAFRFYIDMF